MPIASVPMAGLAALRAKNCGLTTIVATSSDPTDDELAFTLRGLGVAVVRGPLDDVLGRFEVALANVPNEATVVRLTADNVIPDGALLRELIASFEGSGVDYLATRWPEDRMPYGLSAEVFTAGMLRGASRAATTPHDREHVTPWIRRHTQGGGFRPRELGDTDLSHLRCTVDDVEDYERIARLFDGVDDPVGAHWLALVRALQRLPGEPAFRIPYRRVGDTLHSEMTLGTVQLGVDYGIVNRTGKPAEGDAQNIVRAAIAHGVTSLDTARGYGDSERVIGQALAGAWRSRVTVVTKLDPLADLAHDARRVEVSRAVRKSVEASCAALETNTLPTLLLHRWAHRDAWKGAAWSTLLDLRAEGTIGRLGASVYDPEEARCALEDLDVVHLQLPFNLLDRRWQAAGVDESAQARADVVIHARSALLQGLLAHGAERWPPIPGLDAARVTRAVSEQAGRLGRASVVDLCLAFVRAQDWITSVVVGCETVYQLSENLGLFRTPRLTAAECEEVARAVPEVPSRLLNPAKWRSDE